MTGIVVSSQEQNCLPLGEFVTVKIEQFFEKIVHYKKFKCLEIQVKVLIYARKKANSVWPHSTKEKNSFNNSVLVEYLDIMTHTFMPNGL